MPRGSFRESAVEDAAFVLNEGQVSDIVETPNGYWIVKAEKVIPGKSLGFEDAQQEVRQILRAEQFTEFTEEYFKRVQKDATIVYSEKIVEITLDRAVRRYWRR